MSVSLLLILNKTFKQWLNFQVCFSRDLHGRDGYKSARERIHSEQLHLSEKPLELVGFSRHQFRLPDLIHRHGQPGGAEDLQGAQGAQDSLHHAR